MDINKVNLMNLCDEIQNARFLLSIHLNDNGISKDIDLMHELLDIFGLDKRDIPFIKKDDDSKFLVQ